MARKPKTDYFGIFVKMVEYSLAAAESLHDILSHFQPDKLSQKMAQLHGIEHAADIEKHEMMRHLAAEFITPIEREDILRLSQEIDDVTDAVEDVLLRMYMFNITFVKADALLFTEAIVNACRELKTTMEEFRHFKKSGVIHDSIVEINRMEEECDRLYTNAVRTLYVESKDAVEIIAWTEIYAILEKCSDACEHVANMVESVIMKNS